MLIDLLHLDSNKTQHTHIIEPIRDDAISSVGPVDLKVDIIKSGTDVIINGTLDIELLCDCSRCLKKFKFLLHAPFEAQFTINPLDEKQEIELGKDVRQAIILEIPEKPLCRNDCPGLCSRCGKDLSDGFCECQQAPSDNRLAKLKDFKFQGDILYGKSKKKT